MRRWKRTTRVRVGTAARVLRCAYPVQGGVQSGRRVDAILKCDRLPDLLKGAPLIRLNDAGMARKWREYVTNFIERHTRRFDAYFDQQRHATWKKHMPAARSEWPVGVMGVGSIGAVVVRLIHSGISGGGLVASDKSSGRHSRICGPRILEAFLPPRAFWCWCCPSRSRPNPSWMHRHLRA